MTGAGDGALLDARGAPAGPAGQAWMAQRSAASHAGFLTGYLRPGMRLLDCGCGPGSITAGLALAVAPGQVIAADYSAAQVRRARQTLSDAQVPAAQAILADTRALPVPGSCFDAVFAHALLWHPPDPGPAVREYFRVLRPGGILAVRDIDYTTWSLVPAAPELDALRQLTLQVRRQLGKSADQVRDQRGLLVRAGFDPVRTTARCVTAGDADQTRRAARGHINVLRCAQFTRAATETGAASAPDLDEMAKALRRWGERPDAVEVILWRATIAWKTTGTALRLTRGRTGPRDTATRRPKSETVS